MPSPGVSHVSILSHRHNQDAVGAALPGVSGRLLLGGRAAGPQAPPVFPQRVSELPPVAAQAAQRDVQLPRVSGGDPAGPPQRGVRSPHK